MNLFLMCPEGELEEVADLVRKTMENAVSLDVPLKVDVKAGPNWLELAATSLTLLRIGLSIAEGKCGTV